MTHAADHCPDETLDLEEIPLPEPVSSLDLKAVKGLASARFLRAKKRQKADPEHAKSDEQIEKAFFSVALRIFDEHELAAELALRSYAEEVLDTVYANIAEGPYLRATIAYKIANGELDKNGLAPE